MAAVSTSTAQLADLGFAPLERVHTFRLQGAEGLATIAIWLDLIVADPRTFGAELTTVQLGAIAVDSLNASPYVACRTQRHIDADPLGDWVHFGTVRSGRDLLAQDGRASEQLPGATALVRSNAPYRSVNEPAPGGARNHVVLTTVPMTLLPGKAERSADALPAEANEAGTRVRIRDFILRRLPDAELGPQRIASEFGISTRYLHRLFESEDTSVGSFIRRERLKKAASELADPTLRHLDVKTIASRSGFAGADQFARAFKSRYGLSPRDYRRVETAVAGESAARGRDAGRAR